MSVNDRLLDRAINQEIDLRRYQESVVRRLIGRLNQGDAKLIAQLTEVLMSIDRERFTVEALERRLAEVRRTNREAFGPVFSALEREMRELAALEAAAQEHALRQTLPAAVRLAFPIGAVGAEQAAAAALSRPFQGRLLSGWAANVEASRMTAIRNAIRQGYVTGQTTADIIRTIRGTKANGFADGILNRGRREVAAIVQTALSHTAQTARMLFTDANADLIKAVKWVATLDTRTSPMCRIRDGLLYEPRTYKPIGHKVPWGDGPGRLHFNCRSVSVNVTKSWRELGIDMDDLSPGTRASMDGQVPADLTYRDWIKRQPPERQDEILGPTRAALMRSGRVDFPEFYDAKGNLLTIEELRKKLGD